MKNNEAGCDRAVRIVLGLGLLSLTIVGPQTWLGLVGLIPLVTGLWGVCPLYRVFGVSTCPVQSSVRRPWQALRPQTTYGSTDGGRRCR
jgi:hypothetical protein